MPPRTRTVNQEFRTLSLAFRTLASAFDRLAPMMTNGGSANGKAEASSRRKPQLTPERRRALKLHGRYLGSIRGLKPRQRARVKQVRESKGVRAAIAAARRMAG